MARTPMGVQDSLWLTMDRPNNLMVIDTVMWFREVPDWDEVEGLIQDRLIDRYPVFARRPVRDGSGWAWEDDPAFTLADHLIRVTLPAPGSLTELQEFVAVQRSVPFDKTRPLWSMSLIDGLTLPDGTQGAAVMSRFHHAIADGVRLVQVALGMCDLQHAPPSAVGRALRRSTTPAAIAASAARNISGGLLDVGVSAAETMSDAFIGMVDTAQAVAARDFDDVLDRVTTFGERMFRTGSSALRSPDRLVDVARLLSSPENRVVNDVATVGKLALATTSSLAGGGTRTVWTGSPGVAKGANWAALISLEQVKAIRRATGTTVNDVLMAAVAGTLTRYLREHGDDHTDEVFWMIPVSVKPLDTELPTELGNHFALVAFRMPLGIDDVRARLAEIHERMERIKNSDEALLTFSIQRSISLAPATVASTLTNMLSDIAVGVLTNVPGPHQPMTFAGAVVDGVLGWAPCSGSQPMTVCIFSYNGRVAVGFGTDVTLIPDGERLGHLFDQEFTQMQAEVLGPA